MDVGADIEVPLTTGVETWTEGDGDYRNPPTSSSDEEAVPAISAQTNACG